MQLRFGGKYYLYFVVNFMRFSAVNNCENLLRFDTVTANYKAVSFFRTRCIPRRCIQNANRFDIMYNLC